LFVVPEVCAVQHVPSAEVSKVPEAPTAKNETSDEVQVLLLLLLLLSLFLAHEKIVKLKIKINIM
jgi:hypothetical protein